MLTPEEESWQLPKRKPITDAVFDKAIRREAKESFPDLMAKLERLCWLLAVIGLIQAFAGMLQLYAVWASR